MEVKGSLVQAAPEGALGQVSTVRGGGWGGGDEAVAGSPGLSPPGKHGGEGRALMDFRQGSDRLSLTCCFVLLKLYRAYRSSGHLVKTRFQFNRSRFCTSSELPSDGKAADVRTALGGARVSETPWL